MQKTIKKPIDTKGKRKEKSSKEDASALAKNPQEEKLKKSVYSVSTPRNFMPKSSTADIYAQKKKNSVQALKTPKKVPGTTDKCSDVSPMKNILKSSPSSVSQKRTNPTIVNDSSARKNDAKVFNTASARHATPRTARDLPTVNVTVNSPVLKKKLHQDGGKRDIKNGGKITEVEKRDTKIGLKTSEVEKGKILKSDSKNAEERQRTKTRTLNESEVKILTRDGGVDNNVEMLNLTRKLTAKPKAFYVELDEPKTKPQNDKTSEDEVSYEDDFESYESDFESYHESQSENSEKANEHTRATSDEQSEDENNSEHDEEKSLETEEGSKEVKDEEKMLDSGNFDLRDSRSANKAKPMQFILEDTEPDVKSSLTDEGFQEMSSGSSIRTVHTEVLDRPLFIDFTKSKADKRKRKVFERLKQRAKDILSMVTLHAMSYSLFEMKPIPYDVYMATFGRSNYMQSAVQTFEDGISEEVQTEEIQQDDKWTQYPVDFSNHLIHLKDNKTKRKLDHINIEDYLTKFTFLISDNSREDDENQCNLDESYKSSPLRVYFEQKEGVGCTEMLPYETYKKKLKSTDFNRMRLGKFLKKHESRIIHILSTNLGTDPMGLVKSNKYPFSKGFVTIAMKNVTNEELNFVKQAKISAVVVSESRNNLICTIHDKCTNVIDGKCVICLWDVSVAIREPLKILVAIDSVSIARFKGGTDGIIVAALKDGSVHLWDLTEKPMWYPDVKEEKPLEIVVDDVGRLTQTERDREWNAKNSQVGIGPPPPRCLLQACAYTTSASYMQTTCCTDITGLVVDTGAAHNVEAGRRVVGQVCALQRVGLITIWSIIQEKLKNTPYDMGKAYWSKMKLEKKQTISLADQVGMQTFDTVENKFELMFNLNAAKRRTSLRKKEKSLRRQFLRPKSGGNFDANDRPSSAAVGKNSQMLPVQSWEDDLFCNDLKMIRLNNSDNYLVAKNCGEVLCCTKNAGAVKVNRLCVATDLSRVTCIEVSTHGSPHFLAATDSGTVNLCSLRDHRVLLTLDVRNGPLSQELERYQVDSKGRFLGSARPTSTPFLRAADGIAVKHVFWSASNPCCILALLASGTLLTYELTQSDINATSAVEQSAIEANLCGSTLALVTSEGEVEVHSMLNTHNEQQLRLFQKYAALL
ncbi:hypothetical protein evm_006296 [Chilo suppressalis]|nr:hypothetical protein evm_006296 [Chilo suppressalis]